MQQVDTLLIGGTVLTMNQEMDIITDGAVAVQDDHIVAVGPKNELLKAYEATETVDCSGQIIMPGLVNAHTHLSMSLVRGLADDLRLDVWLMGYIMPTERVFVDEHFVYLGAKLAAAELIMCGTTTFADMYYFESEVARATAEAGLRGICSQTILKFPSPDAESYEESFEYAEKFIQEWKDHPLIIPAIAPHAPYTNTDEMLSTCADIAKKYDVPLIIHVSETAQEVEDSRTEFGMPPVPRIKKQGVLDHKSICIHCVHLDQGEMRTLSNHKAGVIHNPSSNLKLASGIAPVQQMLDLDINVGIGTDGTASNNDLDMFVEIHLTAMIAKVATNNPTAVPAKQALLMATRMGAQALHIDDITGSLEAGKRADIITIDPSGIHNTPTFSHDPNSIYAQIVYACKSTDVQDVMCNGQWLMRGRELLTIETEPLVQEAQEIAQKIDQFLINYSNNVMSKLISIASLQRQESFEIQLKTRIKDPSKVDTLLNHPAVKTVKHSHYRQYDTYFLFEEGDAGRVRYREDDFIDENGEVTNVRSRLTYTLPTKEREFEKAVLLSHSQFFAPADRPLRFYREYFRASEEREIHKERMRWQIIYKGVLFYVNLDSISHPSSEHQYLELKSRTWSLRDAEYKAAMISEIISEVLEIDDDLHITEEYVDMAARS